MDLASIVHREIDFNLLKNFASLLSAKKMIRKFEKYSGKIPTEQDFYETYLKYIECKNFHGAIFQECGIIKKSMIIYLNSPKLDLRQVKLLEEYLVHKRIIKEKSFE